MCGLLSPSSPSSENPVAVEEVQELPSEQTSIQEMLLVLQDYFDKERIDFKDFIPQTDHEIIDRIEEHAEQLEMEEFCGVYDFEQLQSLDAEVISENLWRLKISNYFDGYKALPKGYGFKGGGARSLLERALKIDLEAQPRDLDIIRLSTTNDSKELDDEMAQQYMPEDARHGYGVEVVDSAVEYLETRDFTINEVFYTDGYVYCTEECLKDTMRGRLVFTENILNQFYDSEGQEWDRVPSQLLSKAIRFYTDALLKDDVRPVYFQEKFDYLLQQEYLSPFYIALQLERAYEQDRSTAVAFVAELRRQGKLPEEVTTPEECATMLNKELLRRPFTFRACPEEQYDIEETWIESEEYDEYEQLPKQASVRKN